MTTRDGAMGPGSLLIAAAVATAAAGCGLNRCDDTAPTANDTVPVTADSSAEPRTASPERPGIRLVVQIVVDQLPSWTFERDRELFEGGIGRLLREGVYIPEAEFPYSATYTAPGHAAIGTGAPPAVSGILANRWYRRELGRSVSATADDEAPVLAVGSRAPAREGASPRQLATTGVATALREATGGEGRSISIGIKSRAAILATGKHPDLAVWYDRNQRAMTTSAHFADEPPRWLVDLHERRPISDRFVDVWTPLDAQLLAEFTGRPDDGPGEGSIPGFFGNTFPHAIGASITRSRALRLTPSAAEVALDTARAVLDAEDLGGGREPDLLALNFGCHDYAGHYWGQESWERLDLLLRLDRMLGDFFDELDEAFGPDGYAVVLTGDHGAAPLVESSPEPGAVRLPTRQVAQAAQAAMESVLGPGDWFAIRSAASLHFRGLGEVDDDDRERALDAAVAALADLDGVGYAARTDELRGDCDAMTGLDALACRSLGDDLGEIIHFPAPYSLITDSPTGTSHGSPHDYDRIVPMIIRAPGWSPGVIDERVSVLRFAPTVAALLGAPPPPDAPDPLTPKLAP